MCNNTLCGQQQGYGWPKNYALIYCCKGGRTAKCAGEKWHPRGSKATSLLLGYRIDIAMHLKDCSPRLEKGKAILKSVAGLRGIIFARYFYLGELRLK